MSTVLLIGGDAIQERMFLKMFRHLSMRQIHKTDIEDVLDDEIENVELVVLIWGRGELNTFSVKRLQERFQSAPIIVASAHAFEEDRQMVEQLGLDDFLSMPFDFEEFESVVTSLLRADKFG